MINHRVCSALSTRDCRTSGKGRECRNLISIDGLARLPRRYRRSVRVYHRNLSGYDVVYLLLDIDYGNFRKESGDTEGI